MTLTRTKTIIISGALTTLQAFNLECAKLFVGYEHFSILIAILLGGVSMTFAALAHDSNPDGTKAIEAYHENR